MRIAVLVIAVLILSGCVAARSGEVYCEVQGPAHDQLAGDLVEDSDAALGAGLDIPASVSSGRDVIAGFDAFCAG